MTDTAEDLARRIEDLRVFEREYRSRLRSYFWQKIGELNETGDPLDGDQRWSVEEARAFLREWDRGVLEAEQTLAGQIRVLLEVIDSIAPKKEG